ncbi:MAG: hypothetical protein FJZ59_02275 [Chlamydiae bacterium]|nr:hypothetical protein [Chlamydiota bacterium]
MSILNRMYDIRSQHKVTLERQNACMRSLREGNMGSLKDAQDLLNEKHQEKKIGHIIAIVGALLSVIGAGTLKADANYAILSRVGAVGPVLERTSGFMNQLKDSDISMLQGQQEQIRKALENTESDNRELIQLLQEADRILDEIIAEARRSRSAAFDKA